MGGAWTVSKVAATGSTNADLLAMAAAGAPDRSVVVADHQLAGRGRLDRQWEAPPGAALLVSILLRQVPADGPHVLTQQVAVAASRACERLAGAQPVIKWPNDLLIGGAKLAGILAQAGIVGRSVDHVVVGLGLNLTWAPPGAAQLGPIDRDELLEVLLAELDVVASLPDHGFGEYRRRLGTLGQLVRVELPSGALEGVASDVLVNGRLVVNAGDGRHLVDTGDVIHLRPAG